MRAILLPCALLVVAACGAATPATTSPPDGGECPVGYFRAPLGECAIDTKAPPCACVDMATASCCGGDVCCGPGDTSCGMGVPTCHDGVVTCTSPDGFAGFMVFTNLCEK